MKHWVCSGLWAVNVFLWWGFGIELVLFWLGAMGRDVMALYLFPEYIHYMVQMEDPM